MLLQKKHLVHNPFELEQRHYSHHLPTYEDEEQTVEGVRKLIINITVTFCVAKCISDF